MVRGLDDIHVMFDDYYCVSGESLKVYAELGDAVKELEKTIKG